MVILRKTLTKANGKIILCDFKNLNTADFNLYDLEKRELIKEYILVASDGRMYINSRLDGADFVSGIFEAIINESQYTLDQFCKAFKPKYPKVTFENIADMKGSNEEITQAFTLLCIPAELKRRKIEKEYYSKIKPLR